MSKNKMAEENEIASKLKQKEMDSVMTVHTSLQKDFDAASVKIDQLTSQNTKLDSALQSDKAEMAKLQAKIKSVLANKNATMAQLKEAREMIASLTDKTKQYEARIAELEKENTKLTGENKVLTQERDEVTTKNIALKKIGSVLHASNIRMEPIHKRKNGKEKETSRARRVDIMRIMFDIDENRIAESGNKQVYIRIIGPENKVLTSATNASGKLTTSTNDKLDYSVMKEIPLTQGQMVKDVSVDWNQDGDYARGTYNIEIYNEGYKIGGGNVTLK
jgi:hypothetical protein